MPTIFYKYGWRFYFVSFDCSEPPHIHVGNDSDKVCKFWLTNSNGIFEDNKGFSKKELRQIQVTINDNIDLLNNTFNEFCSNYKR